MNPEIYNFSGRNKSVLVIRPSKYCMWKHCSLSWQQKVGHVAKLLFVETCNILTFHNYGVSSAFAVCRCTAMQQLFKSVQVRNQSFFFFFFTGGNSIIVITSQKMIRFYKHKLD